VRAPEGVGHGNPDWNTACTVVESEELMAEQKQNGRLARLARDEEGVAGYMPRVVHGESPLGFSS
jgi:hypothetical protein